MAPSALDLTALRLRLTKMTDRILMRLHDRAGFPLNAAVYNRGAIPIVARSDVSLLEVALEGLERYHSTLGRYEYPDQYPMGASGLLKPAAARHVSIPPLPPVDIPLRDELVTFYTADILPRLCEVADDPDCYGETAYVDADFLELLNERVNVGRNIAWAKVHAEPDIWEIVHNDSALIERLRDEAREERVITDAVAVAARYEVGAPLAAFVFEWIVSRTLSLEVEFLQRVPRGVAPH